MSDPMALPEPVEQSPKAPTIYIIVVVALALLGVLTVLGGCLLYTSDAADERSSVDLGGRRIIKKNNQQHTRAAPRNRQKRR